MSRYLWLVVMLWCTASAADNGQANHLQQVRIQGFMLVNNALAFYNPNGNGMDARFLDRYQSAQTTLDTLLPATGEMRLAFEQIREKLADLEARVRDTPEYLYSHWMNPVLRAHASLDRQAAHLYQALSPPEAVIARHQLNLDLNRLLLLYQTRTFGTLGVFLMTMEENTFSMLDRAVMQGLTALKTAEPEAAGTVSGLISQYEFIRPRLINHGEQWVPGVTAYYLGNISGELSALML